MDGIEIKDGKARMFAVEGIPVWHAARTNPAIAQKEFVTREEALAMSDTDWTAEHRPIFCGDFEIPDRSSIWRVEDDKYLGTVGKKWTIVQNRQLLEWADELCSAAGLRWKTGGSLKGGRVVWYMAEHPRTFDVEGDVHKKYLTISNSFDGSRAIWLTPTDVAVVCWNTLTWSDREVAAKVPHTLNVAQRVEEAIVQLNLIEKDFEKMVDFFRLMRVSETTRENIDEYFQKVAVKARTNDSGRNDFRIALWDRFEHGLGQQDRGGYNLYRGFNAVTDFVDHRRRPSDMVLNLENEKDREIALDRGDNRLLSAFWGVDAKVKRFALRKGREMAAALAS
jgi:phage/plasmid-like protein (TIGR03299 family)